MAVVKRTPFILVIVLWLSGVLAAGQFAKISVTFPYFREAFSSHGATLGFLVSLVSTVGLVCGLFAGAFVARVGARKPLVAALCLGAGLSIYQSSIPSFAPFLISRLFEGLSHLLIVVAAPTVLGQVTEPRHRAVTMASWSTVFAVSFAVFSWGGTSLVDRFGVPFLFLCHGVGMVVAAFAVWIFLPSHIIPRSPDPLTLRAIVARHITAYTSPWIVAPAAGWFFYAAGFVALVTVMPDFFTPEHRHALVGILPLSALCVSMTLGIALVRRFTSIPVVIGGFCISMAMTLSLAFGVPVEWAGIAILATTGLAQAGSFSAIPVLNVAPQDQALANGALAQLGNAGNMVGTPLLILLTNAFGLNGLIIFAATTFGCGAVIHLWLARLRRG
ncbi:MULTISPECIES: MFS transporter [Pacificibacter]|uniref:MFS transporter n=1 Tax=Pacificibacter TaxID=1042323 RepID=UPI001C08FBBB|nr:MULTISPECIES: MFS transporter [Pacificibacter]MBU2935971.1 MFS transporter [Pacificibacter marinus]MDO6615180.1 MFS transporter [Pacificibacter sp. 1_MG-2023]